MRQLAIVMLLVLGTVAACGGRAATAAPSTPVASLTTGASQPTAAPAQATPAAPTQPATPTQPPANAGGAGTSVAHVVVGSGPSAGTYDAAGPKVDCNKSATGSGATYQDLAKADGVSGITFVANDGGPNPKMLYIQVFFGLPVASQQVLEMSTLTPRSTRGSATAQLEDKGATIKWNFDATTAEGVSFKGSVECGPVDRR